MVYFQKRKQLRQIKSDIETLCMYKITLKTVGTFDDGLSYLNNQFDMTEYAINNLNRSLTIYLGREDCLKECLELLHKMQNEYIKERKIQTENLNEINSARQKMGLSKCALTTDTEAFIYKYHRIISQIQEIAHNTTIKYTTEPRKEYTSEIYKTYLDKNEISKLYLNNQLYSQLFALENNLRKYILAKYNYYYNETSLSNWLKKEQQDNYSKRKNEENKFGVSSRGDNIVYYLDFNDLGNLIQTHFKEGFEEDFKRIDDIVPKLNYLYLIRCKIAHNSLFITNDEVKMTEVYTSYILRNIFKKY